MYTTGEWQLLPGKPKNRSYQMGFVSVLLSAAQWGLSLWFPGGGQSCSRKWGTAVRSSVVPRFGAITGCFRLPARAVGAAGIVIPPRARGGAELQMCLWIQ